jgi:hypothetical protein
MAAKLSHPKYRKNVEEAQRLFIEVSEELYGFANELLESIDEQYESSKDALNIQFARMIFRLGFEFYRSGKYEAEQDNIVGLASAIRSGIENTANLKFILGNNEADFTKRAKKYVASYKTYNDGLVKLAADVKLTVEDRAMKEINPWTTSSVTDRVRGENKAILATYDWMSHFAHPNPGILNYYWEFEVKEFHCKMFLAHNSAAFLTLIQRLSPLINLNKPKVLVTKVYFRKISDAFELLAFVG